MLENLNQNPEKEEQERKEQKQNDEYFEREFRWRCERDLPSRDSEVYKVFSKVFSRYGFQEKYHQRAGATDSKSARVIFTLKASVFLRLNQIRPRGAIRMKAGILLRVAAMASPVKPKRNLNFSRS